MIEKHARILLFFIVLTSGILCSRDNFSISAYDDKIYVLDGFGKELYIYSKTTVLLNKIHLKNISPSGFFDFFIRYDDFISYLVDSEKGVIYILDENYILKKRSDIVNSHGIAIYKKIFPTGYNSVLIAAYDKKNIYSLKNNILKEILSFEKEFTDIYFRINELYVFFGSDFSVYSAEGRYIRSGSLYSEKKISSFFSTDSLKLEDTVYFFDPDSLKLRSAGK